MNATPFFWIDAFTSIPMSGNPCAVFHVMENWVHWQDADYLRMAKEMGLSETAFVRQATGPETRDFDFEARYFTPEGEIPLAGHPTLATVRSLMDSRHIPPEQSLIRLKLPAGIVRVEIHPDPVHGQVFTMEQKKPEFFQTVNVDDVARTFGLDRSDFKTDHPPQIVSTGTRSLQILVHSLDSLRKIRVSSERYLELRDREKFFSAHLFTTTGATVRGQTFARHPGSTPDIIEDPFTGSSTGGMAAYLWKRGLISTPHFVAEQGHWLGRPGEATVEVIGPRDDIQTVRVGGPAVTLIRGEYQKH